MSTFWVYCTCFSLSISPMKYVGYPQRWIVERLKNSLRRGPTADRFEANVPQRDGLSAATSVPSPWPWAKADTVPVACLTSTVENTPKDYAAKNNDSVDSSKNSPPSSPRNRFFHRKGIGCPAFCRTPLPFSSHTP